MPERRTTAAEQLYYDGRAEDRAHDFVGDPDAAADREARWRAER